MNNSENGAQIGVDLPHNAGGEDVTSARAAGTMRFLTLALRWIAALSPRVRGKATFTAILVCLSLGMSQPSFAGWVSQVPGGGTDFGGDYYAAAVDSLNRVYGFSAPDKGAYFFSPGIFWACHSYSISGTVCGIAAIECTSPAAPSINGCLSSLLGYQGRCNCNRQVGDPVDTVTGNLFEVAEDFRTAAPSLSARRYYNSDTNYMGLVIATTQSRFGYGWRSEFDSKMYFNVPPPSAGIIDIVLPDGTPLHFYSTGSSWVSTYFDFTTGGWSTATRTDVDYRLTTDGSYWYLIDSSDTTYKYNNSGQLQTISYRGGYQQTLTYDGSGNNTVVADSLGRQITFTYLANGLASTLSDPDGNVFQYAYTNPAGVASAPSGSQGLWVLNQVTYPATSGTPTLTYLYGDTRTVNNFALTGITDENGHSYATWTYDAQGRVLSSTLAGGANQNTISYNDTTNTRTVTNALSKQFTYNTGSFQQTLQLSSVVGAASMHTAASTVSYAYDTNGYVSQITDANGNITQYTNNSLGQVTSETDGYGSSVARTITTTWDATWREPDKIVAPNVTTDFTYDTSGRLTQLKLTDTTTTTLPYSTNGQTRIWGYTYYSNGLLNTVDGPLAGSGDTTTYAYNATGFVNSITDVLGHVTTISSTNGRGEPLTSIDPNGITTNYTYDDRGRVTSITVHPGANQSQTSFSYDATENLTVITRPDGSSLTYAYDNAHRVTSITNNLGETITYTLDALGNRTATVVKSATSTITKQETATFDELGRVMANIGAASQTTTHAYDLNDNEITTTDPRSKVYGHAFDALNRLYQQTDPDSFHTTLAFNAQDGLTSVTDARSLATTYVRDGFGDAIQQTSPDTGATVVWYDANGKVIKRVDARSVETDYTNDNGGRVLTKTFPASSGENVTYNYDSTAGSNEGVGYLTSINDQSGSSSFIYDPLNHVTSDTRVIGTNSYGTTYTYDPAGNILTETYPSGRIVTYTRDVLGRISSVTTKQNSGATAVNVATSVSYEPFGSVSGLTFGNSLGLTLTYDQDYQLTGIAASAGATTIQSLTNGFDQSGNITSITDAVTSGRTQAVTYDDLNRLATAGGVYGSQSYTYDGVGNRLTRVIGTTADTYAYLPTTNQVSTITTGSNVRTFSYLANGQVSSDVRDSTHNYSFTANNNGRNASASLNGTTAGAYLYNALEQRVQKVAGSTTTQFVYDRFGHLLEEASASGVAQKEYIWLDDMPVALVDDTGSSPVLYYIHTDQLGTPQKITDGSMNIVWDGVFDPFGNPVGGGSGSATWGSAQWGSFNWGATGPSLSLTNLRFPGQYFDAETALNYNYLRDYDPTIGRYIQSDPASLRGGINTYSYVENDPLDGIDQFGRWRIYGNWCGPDWTGGYENSWNTMTPSERKNAKAPIDPLDAACEKHDKCYGACRDGYPCDQNKRADCLLACDNVLKSSAFKIGGFFGNVIGAAMGRPGARNEVNDPRCQACKIPGK
jgi:RHS repeat-associated protein